MLDVYNYSLLTIFLAALAVILTVTELCYRLGLRWGLARADNVVTLEGAALGLLALMIGFTFAMALSRFEARRDAVVAEANAIGTVALRAQLLAEPSRSKISSLLKEYAALRFEIIRASKAENNLQTEVDRSMSVQEALWRQAATLAASENQATVGLLIQALNAMIDSETNNEAALSNRLPDLVPFILFAIATVAGGFAGYGGGLQKSSRPPIYVMGVMVAGIILLILDFDRPNAGLIEVSQQEWSVMASKFERIGR
jgi:hypothetical protein